MTLQRGNATLERILGETLKKDFLSSEIREERWDLKKKDSFNPLTPNDHYSCRTAPLTSKRRILYIYSTNIGSEYFKYGIYSQFFSLKMQFVS